MSSIQDKRSEGDVIKQAETTDNALASLHQERLASEARGYGLMAAVMGYGVGATGDGLFGKMSRGAKWFCLWFAMVVPVFLFWSVMF